MRGLYLSEKTGLGERYESSYELTRFKALDSSPLVKSWTRQHGIRIPYRRLGRRHRYSPDIRVEYHDGRIFLEEVKGYVWEHLKFGLKNVAAVIYCARHGMTFRVIFREGLTTVE